MGRMLEDDHDECDSVSSEIHWVSGISLPDNAVLTIETQSTSEDTEAERKPTALLPVGTMVLCSSTVQVT